MKKYKKNLAVMLLSIMFSVLLMACASETMSQSVNAGTDAVSGETIDEAAKKSDIQNEIVYREEELLLYRDGLKIYGKLYMPDEGQDMPLVILSHGFGSSHKMMEGYAETFAQNGIAAYAFDFIGGASSTLSDGNTTEMSVLTEAKDLGAVLDYFIADDRFDGDKIFLMGESQGGFVSTYVAGTRSDDVAGLVALYPAYVLQDNARQMTPDFDNIPDTMNLMGTTIGSIYNRDALSFDIYDIMQNYSGKTLIIHGTSDTIAPISYSRRAAEVFPDARLIELEGVNHGFYGDSYDLAALESLDFIKEIIPEKNKDSRTVTDDNTDDMLIRVSDGTNEVVFRLNDSPSAISLYNMLPLDSEVENYGSNEKIFYPQDKVDTTDGIEGNGEAGGLALFSPWGNIVMYYSSFGSYPGLYILGEAEQGTENIEKLSGTIHVETIE